MPNCDICRRDIQSFQEKVALITVDTDQPMFLEMYHKSCWEKVKYGNKGNPNQSKYFKKEKRRKS